jgi:hypothetical protein
MGKTVTNISIILGLLSVTFGAYYLFTQYSTTSIDTETNEQVMRDMLNNTRVYNQRSSTLNNISLDIGLFEDVKFTSLRKFTTPILEQEIGRKNPFSEVGNI